jgi:hypothetical protein
MVLLHYEAKLNMKHINIIVISILIMAASSGSGEEAKKKTGEKYFYILNYSFSRADAEIFINGVPVAKSKKEFNYSSSGFSDVGQWIFKGVNTATVKVSSLIEKKGDTAVFPPVEFSISIATEGQMSSEGTKIIQFRLPKPGDPASAAERNIKPPFKKEFSFIPEFPPPSELWSKAAPTTLNNENKKLISKLITEYHSALAKKDVDKLFDLLQFRVKDISQLRYYPKEEALSRFKDDLKEMVATEGFAMEALNQKTLMYHPLINGKIIWITDPLRREPLNTKQMKDSGRMSFAVYVSLIDGKWTIVR